MGRYQVNLIKDDLLPEDRDWLWVYDAVVSYLYVKESTVRPEVIEDAWLAYTRVVT